jgi:PhnB protein
MNDSSRTDDRAAIRALIEATSAAIRAKDVDRALEPYVPDALFYDLAPPLRTVGPDREAMQAWFDSWNGEIDHEVTELDIAVEGNLALAHGINRIGGTKTDGEKVDIWVRMTLGLRKEDGSWRVMHEHISVPFYMDGSYKAAVDLEP